MHLHLRRRPRRAYVITAVSVLVVAGGLGAWLLTRSSPAAAQTATMTVSSGTFKQTVTATGTLAPAREADLSFAVSGRVTSVPVEVGDTVEKGQVLARVDRTSLEAARTSAQAQLDAAQSAAAADTGESSSQIASDAAGVASAEADLSQAQADLDAATLRATFTGTIAAVDVAVGDQVGSGSGTGSGAGTGAGTGGSTPAASDSSIDSSADTSTAAVTVISPKAYVVDATVSADDVKQVKKGLQATVTPTGATTPVYGTVRDIGLVAETNSSGAATFPVTIAVTGRQANLYAGTSADVSIVIKQVPDVLTVPSLALHTGGGTTYVEKVVGGTAVRTTVKLGETYGASTEVTSGLKSGDKVQITTPGELTRNGSTRGGDRGGRLPGIPGGGGFGGPPGGGNVIQGEAE